MPSTAKRAGIRKKRIHGYMFRHGSATRNAKYFTVSELNRMYGWSKGPNWANSWTKWGEGGARLNLSPEMDRRPGGCSCRYYCKTVCCSSGGFAF